MRCSAGRVRPIAGKHSLALLERQPELQFQAVDVGGSVHFPLSRVHGLEYRKCPQARNAEGNEVGSVQ